MPSGALAKSEIRPSVCVSKTVRRRRPWCQVPAKNTDVRAILGPNESRTRGAGPQINYIFTIGNTSIYTNLRGYTEFGSDSRLQGHSTFVTISVPLSALFQGHSRSPSGQAERLNSTQSGLAGPDLYWSPRGTSGDLGTRRAGMATAAVPPSPAIA
jgi:hypothetical protein